jgi:hypothetical protein
MSRQIELNQLKRAKLVRLEEEMLALGEDLIATRLLTSDPDMVNIVPLFEKELARLILQMHKNRLEIEGGNYV